MAPKSTTTVSACAVPHRCWFVPHSLGTAIAAWRRPDASLQVRRLDWWRRRVGECPWNSCRVVRAEQFRRPQPRRQPRRQRTTPLCDADVREQRGRASRRSAAARHQSGLRLVRAVRSAWIRSSCSPQFCQVRVLGEGLHGSGQTALHGAGGDVEHGCHLLFAQVGVVPQDHRGALVAG